MNACRPTCWFSRVLRWLNLFWLVTVSLETFINIVLILILIKLWNTCLSPLWKNFLDKIRCSQFFPVIYNWNAVHLFPHLSTLEYSKQDEVTGLLRVNWHFVFLFFHSIWVHKIVLPGTGYYMINSLPKTRDPFLLPNIIH